MNAAPLLRTVRAANVGQTLTELEMTLDLASQMCPHLRVGESVAGLFQNARIHLSAVRKGRPASGVVSSSPPWETLRLSKSCR